MDCSTPGCLSLSPGVCSNSCPLLPPSPLGRQLMPLSWCTSWGWSPDVQGCLGKRVLCPLDRHLRVYNQVYNFHILIHQKKKKWWEKASYSIIISNLIWCGYWAQVSREPSHFLQRPPVKTSACLNKAQVWRHLSSQWETFSGDTFSGVGV